MFSSTSATCVNDLTGAEADVNGTNYRVSTHMQQLINQSHCASALPDDHMHEATTVILQDRVLESDLGLYVRLVTDVVRQQHTCAVNPSVPLRNNSAG